MSGGLPLGWARTTLEQVVENISYGFTASASTAPVGPQFLRITDLQDRSVQWESVPYCKIPASKIAQYRLRDGDIVFARTGATTGKSFLITSCPAAVFASYLIRVRLSTDILPEFVAYFFQSQSYWNQVNENISGSAQPNCNASKLKTLNLPIAPNNEQRRIVSKLEKLLDRVDSCQKRLAKIPILLKRFRQAVVAAACSGELTLDWRAKSQSCSEFEDVDLPGGWNWQTVHNLVGPNGLFDGPFGSNLKTADYTGHGVRVIRLENIAHLKFLNEKKAFISEQKYQNLRKHTVRGGDIIFSSFIDEEIRVCVLPPLPMQAIAKADCFCLRPNGDSVDTRYLTLQLASRATYNTLLEKVHGATRPRINTTQLRDLIVPVCPLDEQHEIVRRVDELFSLADQVEARYAKAKQYVDSLKQSIFAKAFRGELVPQDPNDEPASVMLERIREARSTEPSKRFVTRTSKSGVQSVS